MKVTTQNTGSDVGQRLLNEIPRIIKIWDEQVRESLPSTRNLNNFKRLLAGSLSLWTVLIG